MEISGIKKLKRNNYEQIKIRDGKIKVLGGDTVSTIKQKSDFDYVKILSDNEIIDLICSYFTRYHSINYINERLAIGEVRTSDGKTLSYEKPLPQKGAVTMLENYIFSRENFVLNEDINNVKISVYQKESLYRVQEDKALFTLGIDKDGKLLDMEIKFLSFLLETLFKNEKVSLGYTKSALWDNIELYSENHTLEFSTLFLHDERIKEIFENFVLEHNNNLNKNRVLQMKMEEF